MLRDGLAGLINHGIGTVQERLIVNYYGKQEKGENSAVYGTRMDRAQITDGADSTNAAIGTGSWIWYLLH